MENRNNPGWFARPEKFSNDRPNMNSFNRSQRGNMNRSNEGGQGLQHQVAQSNYEKSTDLMLFDEADYQAMQDDEDSSGHMLRPESPY